MNMIKNIQKNKYYIHKNLKSEQRVLETQNYIESMPALSRSFQKVPEDK